MIAWRVRASATSIPDRAAVGRVRRPDRVRRAPRVLPTHPWGCHRRRIPDRVVFDHVIAAWCTAAATNASPPRAARTAPSAAARRVGRRRARRALLRTALAAYDQMIGLDLDDLSVDGSSPSPPAGARSPGAPRSTGANRARNAPWPATARASRCTWSRPGPTTRLAAAGADPGRIVDMIGPLPQYRACTARTSSRRAPGPRLRLGQDPRPARSWVRRRHRRQRRAGTDPGRVRWPVERTHSWINGYGKLRRFTDKRKVIVEFYLYLAAALTVIRRLINQARSRYRWPTGPPPADSADHQLPVALSLAVKVSREPHGRGRSLDALGGTGLLCLTLPLNAAKCAGDRRPVNDRAGLSVQRFDSRPAQGFVSVPTRRLVPSLIHDGYKPRLLCRGCFDRPEILDVGPVSSVALRAKEARISLMSRLASDMTARNLNSRYLMRSA